MPDPDELADRARPAASWPRWRTLLVCLALALVVYLPAALRAGFLGFDDNFYFGPDNEVFRQGFLAVFDPSRPIANAFLPVAHASLWLDWWLFGGHPFFPHLHSIVLHASCGFAVVRLALRLGIGPVAAHLAGALFLLHPALAESVAWVSGRKDLLAALGGLAAIHLTVGFARNGGLWRAVLAIFFSAFAMYAKATAVVLPALALLMVWPCAGRRSRFALVGWIAVVCGAIAWHHQTIAVAEGTMLESADRWRQIPGAFLHYLKTSLWPVGLNVLYPEVQTLERFRAAFETGIAALAGFSLLAGGLLAVRGRTRLAGLALLAFVAALAPFNTAFPASSIAAADRYLYLALPWLALAVVAVADRWGGPVGLGLLALAAFPLGARTGSRAHDFTSTERLWRSSLRVEEDNAVAHFNLASELMGTGRLTEEQFAEVEEHLRAAVRSARYPVHEVRARRILLALDLQRADYQAAAAQARAAIAAAEAQLRRETSPNRRRQAETLLVEVRLESFEPLRLAGDDEGARRSYEAAVTQIPGHPEVVAFGALLDLAEVARELQVRATEGKSPVLAEEDPRAKAALARIDASLAEHPDHPSLWFARASWSRVCGNYFLAIRDYTRAERAERRTGRFRIDPWLEASRMLREREEFEAAARHAKEGLQLRDDPALRQEWAMALVGLGRLDDAILQLEAYLRVRPEDRDTRRILANVLTVRAYARLSEPGGSRKEALELVERALAYDPAEPKAHLVLGRIANERRDFAAAVEHLEKAYRALPGFEDARRQLADALRNLGIERRLAGDLSGAADAFLRCLEVAPEETDVEGVRLLVQGLWRQHERRGVTFLEKGDAAAAAAEFRSCLRLDPEQHWAAWLLALALRNDPDADLAELEALCAQAAAWQRDHDLDDGQQVYLQASTMAKRGKEAEAKGLARDWLAGEHPDTSPEVRAAIERLAGGGR